MELYRPQMFENEYYVEIFTLCYSLHSLFKQKINIEVISTMI